MKYAVTIRHQGQTITVVVTASKAIVARQLARQALARAEITKVEIAPQALDTTEAKTIDCHK